MGAYASNMRGDGSGSIVSEFSHPGKDDWITLHAAASHLSVVEVERLWHRFQQLGSSEHGLLVAANVIAKPPASQDIFSRNIITNIMAEDGTITFQTYLNAMKWAESTEMIEKVRAIFHLLVASVDSKELKRDLLRKIMTRVYREDSPEAVERITNIFFEQMDTKNQGFIDEDQFVSWVQTLPAETMSSILTFNIMPPEMAQSRKTTPQIDMPSSVDTIAHQIPTDTVLKDIAEPASKRDWHLVANKLGHTIDDISKFENEHPNKKVAQVMAMLKAWRSREGASAFVETLENALRDSNMNDIALRLYP